MGTVSQVKLYHLRYNSHETTLAKVFDRLLSSQTFVDVTLACETVTLKAHKLLLCAVSPYFQKLLMNNPCEHPVFIIHDIEPNIFRSVVDFIYKGEVSVTYDRLNELKKWADKLQIEGLNKACQSMIDMYIDPSVHPEPAGLLSEDSDKNFVSNPRNKKNKRRSRRSNSPYDSSDNDRTRIHVNSHIQNEINDSCATFQADLTSEMVMDGEIQPKIEPVSSDYEASIQDEEGAEVAVTDNDELSAANSNENYNYSYPVPPEHHSLLAWALPSTAEEINTSKSGKSRYRIGPREFSGGAERFACDMCAKTFKTKNILVQHRYSHNPNRPTYICNLCGRRYQRNVELKRHHNIKHPLQPLSYKLDKGEVG